MSRTDPSESESGVLSMLHAAYQRYRAAYAGLPREIWMLSFVLFVNRCGTMVLPFLTLYLTSQQSFSDAAAVRMIGVYGIGSVVGSYAGGRLCQVVGPIRLQTICMFLAAPLFLVIPFCQTVWTIAASLFVASVVVEAVRPANAASITKLTSSENRTRAFALHRLAANLGFSFGPAVGGVLATIRFELLFIVDAATLLLAAAVLLRFFKLREVNGVDVKGESVTVRVKPLHDRLFIGFLLLILTTEVVFFQFGSTYPLYMRDHYGLTKPLIGLLFAVNTLLIVAFEMVLVDAVRQWRLLPTIGWGCLLACLGFGLLPFGSTFSFAVMAMTVVTLGEMLHMPLAAGFVANRSGPGSEGLYMGWYSVAISAAFVLGPFIGSAIYALNRDALWFACLGVGVLIWCGFAVLNRFA